MKEIVVLSGKGGTGKTSIVASLAVLAGRTVLCDCDVDAADLHLLLNPVNRHESEFWCGQVALIDPGKCTQCGLCEQLCRFSAIRGFEVDSMSCEGCGFCYRICPAEAITMKEDLAGHLFISETRYGTLAHARLGIARGNSGKLVAEVKKQAKRIAEEQGLDWVISDGPPGIGCPAISSLSGATLALLVTEPTLSGMHDLERVIEVCRLFGVRAAVCINKCDINTDNTRRIEDFCSGKGLEVVAGIPFDNAVTEALVRGVPVVEYSHGKASAEMGSLWNAVCAAV